MAVGLHVAAPNVNTPFENDGDFGTTEVCQQFRNVGDLYYCARNAGNNGISKPNDTPPGEFGQVNTAAGTCLEPDVNDDDDASDVSCATRCDFTSPSGAAVTGNTAGSRTVQEFTILTKRFDECYPEFAGTGSDTYQAEDGSALTDRDSCYKPYLSNGHCKRAHTKNGQPWCQEAFLGSFYFALAAWIKTVRINNRW